MSTEHRILKIGDQYELQHSTRRLGGLLVSPWRPYFGGIYDARVTGNTVQEVLNTCRDLLKKGETIPIIETVTVS